MNTKNWHVHEHHHFFSMILVSIVGILGCSVFVLYYALGSRASDVNSIPRVDLYEVTKPANVVNQEGSKLVSGQGTWIGTGANKTNATLGIYYEAVRIPANTTITSAKLVFMAPRDQWIQINTNVAVEKSVKPLPFSNKDLPARRSIMGAVAYSNNLKWTANTRDTNSTIDVTSHIKMLQTLAGRAETAPVAFVIKSTGGAYSRKYFYNTPVANTPQLIIQYSESSSTPLPSPTTAAPTMAPTATTMVMPSGTPMVMPTTSTQPGSNSQAMGKWTPNPKFDFCTRNGVKVGATDSEASAFVKAAHDAIFVIGPDGKKYPTWHAPVVTLATGEVCKFGHEHGRDPKLSEVWKTKQVQTYFYYDANGNGTMDAAEEAVTGLPFGYVNEQMDTYYKDQGKNVMRHEDHVGHKVDWANGEADIATHNMSTSTTGGVWVGDANEAGRISPDTGVRCYYLAKPHQGTSSPDAFVNNLHEVFYFSDCRHTNSANNQKVSMAVMEAFGDAGSFINFMPMCKIERRLDEQDRITLGTDAMNSQYPKGDHGSGREIISRQCIEVDFLVPTNDANDWSGNMYEAWPAALTIEQSTGKILAGGINLLFDVEEANRYYYPDALKVQRGYVDAAGKPKGPANLGYSMDLCYDRSVPGRAVHGGPCDVATDYGNIKGITWDDPRSAFKGTNRGMYFQPPYLANSGGPEVWYTDPFGKGGKTTPFPGAVKQLLTPKNLDYNSLLPQNQGYSIDPRVNNRNHSDIPNGNTIHAPN